MNFAIITLEEKVKSCKRHSEATLYDFKTSLWWLREMNKYQAAIDFLTGEKVCRISSQPIDALLQERKKLSGLRNKKTAELNEPYIRIGVPMPEDLQIFAIDEALHKLKGINQRLWLEKRKVKNKLNSKKDI